jgi:predicted GNAT family acetyltransferase
VKRLKKNFVIKFDQKSKGPWKRFKMGSHFQYLAYYENVEIGNISVFKNGVNVYVNTVFVKTNYRGRGFGYQLYEFALLQHGCLSTLYFSASDDAKRVWRKLIKKYRYETDFFKELLTIYTI